MKKNIKEVNDWKDFNVKEKFEIDLKNVKTI